jgi:hypothetical protein
MPELLAGGKATQMGVTACQQALQGFPQIDQQLPAVDNLTCIRSAFTRAPRILGRTVTHNDVESRVVLQPGGEGVGAAVRQQVNGTTSAEVNQDRPVDPTLTQGKIVHTKHLWRGDSRCRCGAQHPRTG